MNSFNSYIICIQKIFVFFLLSYIGVGCSEKRVDNPIHKQAPEFTPIIENIDNDFKSIQSKMIAFNETVAEAKKHPASLNDPAVIDNTIRFLDFFLSPKVLENYKKFDEKTLSTSLNVINQSIIESYSSEPDPEKLEIFLKKYYSALLRGCTANSIKNCQNLSFFANDHLTSNVISIIALKKEAENPKNFFTLLLLAKELRSYSDTPSQQIDNDLIKYSIKVFSNLFYLSKNENDSLEIKLLTDDPKKLEEIRIYADYIASIFLLHFNESNSKSRNYDKESISILFQWIFNSNFPELIGYKIAKKYFQFLSTVIPKDDFSDAIVAITKKIESRKANTASSQHIEKNYFQAYNEIKQSMPVLLNLLSEKESPDSIIKDKSDFVFLYIAQNIFHNQKFSQLELIWNISKKDYSRMIDIMLSVEKIFFLNTIMRSHKYLAGKLNNINQPKKDFATNKIISPDKILTAIVGDIKSDLSPIWSDFNSRHNRMKLFFERFIEPNSRDSKSDILLKKSRYIKNYFDELHNNTKFFLTYPSLIMLAYYAQKHNYQETIYDSFLPGGKFTITPNIFISELLNGVVPPLYIFTDYAEDKQSISQVEMMYSMYFILENNLLSLYGVPINDWFQKIADAYFKEDNLQIQKWSKKFDTTQKANGASDSFSRYCNLVNPKWSNTNNFTYSISPDTIWKYSFTGLATTQSSNTKPDIVPMYETIQPSHHYKFDSINEALEVLRMDITPKLKRIQLIFSMIQKNNTISVEDKNLLNNIIRKQNIFRSQLLEGSENIIQTITACVFPLLEAENTRQFDLLTMENKFYELVFYVLDALTTFQSPNESATSLKNRFPEHPIWTHPAFTKINPSISIFESLSQFLAEISGMNEAFESIKDYGNDYKLYSGIQPTESGGYSFIYRKIDLTVRLSQFLKNGFLGKQRSLKNDSFIIQYPDNLILLQKSIHGNISHGQEMVSILHPKETKFSFEERKAAFQQNMLKNFKGDTSYFFNPHSNIEFFRRLLASHVSLYKTKLEFPIEEEAILECTKKCSSKTKDLYRTYIKNIIQVNRSVLNILNLNSFINDTAILDLFNAKSYYTYYVTGPDNLFINNYNANYNYAGFSDTIFNFATSYHLGNFAKFRNYQMLADEDFSATGFLRNMDRIPEDAASELYSSSKRLQLFQGAQNIADSIQKRQDRLLFTIPSETLKRIDAYFTHLFTTEMRFTHTVEEQIKVYAKNNKIPAMQFDLRANPFEHDYLISPYLLSSFYEEIRDLNSKTFKLFLPDELSENPNYTFTD